jgi:hypothetical protein
MPALKQVFTQLILFEESFSFLGIKSSRFHKESSCGEKNKKEYMLHQLESSKRV